MFSSLQGYPYVSGNMGGLQIVVDGFEGRIVTGMQLQHRARTG